MKAREMDKAVRRLVFQHGHNLKALDQEQKLKAKEKKEQEQGTVVEKVTEHILVNIPDKLPQEELPAVLSAMNYYVQEAHTKAAAWSSMRKNYRKELTVNLHAICYFSDVQEIITKVLDVPVYVPGSTPMPISNYDMYCSFDAKLMKTVRDNGKFHASSAYGIMLGCEAQSLFTIPVERITAKVEDKESVNILVIDDALYHYEKVWQWLGETVTTLKVSRVVPYLNHFSAMIAAIDCADLVVGPTSMYTYLACCMKKPTFEIYPPDISRNWLSKWSNPLYSMYVSAPDQLDKDKLLKGVSFLWQKALALLTSQADQSKAPVPLEPTQEQIQTAPSQ
jgi:hypothetical protein